MTSHTPLGPVSPTAATLDPSSAAQPARRRIRRRRRSRPHLELLLLFTGLAAVAAVVALAVQRLAESGPDDTGEAGIVTTFRPDAPNVEPRSAADTAGPQPVSIPLTLLGRDGRAAPNVALHVVPSNPRASGWEHWDSQPVSMTDDKGAARVRLLSSRTYRIVARTSDAVAWSEVVDPSAPARLTLRFQDATRVSGTVTSTDGAPLPGARLVVTFAGEGASELEVGGVAAARGKFELPPFAAGSHAGPHRIRVTAPGHAPLEQEFSAADLAGDGLHVVLKRRFR